MSILHVKHKKSPTSWNPITNLINYSTSLWINSVRAVSVFFLAIMMCTTNICMLLLSKYWSRDKKVTTSLESPINKPSVIKTSIIIVTYNSARCIGETLRNLETATLMRSSVDIVIVDLGSTDGTLDVAKTSTCVIPVSFVKTDKIKNQHGEIGKESAYNLGYEYAKGNILLLMRPDALLAVGYDETIRNAYQNQDLIMGAFRLNLYHPSILTCLSLSYLQYFLAIRWECCQFPHLLQGITVRANAFMGSRSHQRRGMADDLLCIHKIRSQCMKNPSSIAVFSQNISYSPKRWEGVSIFKYLLQEQVIFCLHKYLGEILSAQYVEAITAALDAALLVKKGRL